MAVVASKVVVLIWAVLALTGRALAVNIESTDVFQDCLNDTATCVNIALPSKELTGSIPTDIATFTALTVLNLGQNSLAGTIPTNLPTSLQELRLGFNEIGGTLPLELGLLTSLTMLDFSYNHIKGAMPPHVGNMTSLRYFLVPFNSLTGSIPTTIGSLSQLRAFMVSANSLSGSIPATIDDLENLTSPGCELTYPLYDIPANRFEVPISIKVKAKCVVEDPTDPLRADPHRHLTCQMCMNHRCGSDDPHSCGAKMGYEDPSGYQKNKCMCGCCHLQCAISKWCESHLESEEDPLVDPQPRLPRGRLHHSDARSRAWLAPVLKAAGATAIVSGMVIAAYMGVSRRTPSVPQV